VSDITVKQAALLTGKTKETINKATNDGTLTVSRNAQGHKIIAVSELERVFPLVKTMDEINGQSSAVRKSQNQSDWTVRSDSEALQSRVRHLEEIAILLNKERLREREQMQSQIDNLQSTLEKSQQQHSNALLLITDQSNDRAGEYEQSMQDLTEQVSQFDERLSDVQSDTRKRTIKEIKDHAWWDLVFRRKLRA